MNNDTIKKFDITIKLRGDNVYDLYIDGEWVASRGSCESILEDVKSAVKKSLLAEQVRGVKLLNKMFEKGLVYEL